MISLLLYLSLVLRDGFLYCVAWNVEGNVGIMKLWVFVISGNGSCPLEFDCIEEYSCFWTFLLIKKKK